MASATETSSTADRELVLTRIIDAPREKIFRAWPELLRQWFAPHRPVLHWTVTDREMHEKMGFRQGWAQCTDQLAALTAKI